MEKVYTVKIPENNKILFYKNFLVILSPFGFIATNLNKYIAQKDYILTLDKFSLNIFYQALNTNIKRKNFFSIQYLQRIQKIFFGLNHFYINKLVLQGTGFRLFTKYIEYNSTTNKVLVIKVGYSEDLCIDIPINVLVNCLNQTVIEIVGLEKDKVNGYCKLIKNYKKPDSYKGKGIGFIQDKVSYKQRKKS